MHRERRVVSATPVPDEDGPSQDGLPRRFWVRAVNYATLDDFGTKFDKGAFEEYLQHRQPRFLYGHNWSDPSALVGKGVGHRSSRDGLDIQFELDDFDYVPAARQIAYQVKNGTLDQFSVDFIRQGDRRDAQGVTWITKARLPAVSGVPEGAVPGTRVLTRAPGVRFAQPGATVSLSEALNILTHLALGEMDLPDALSQLKMASQPDEDEEQDDEKEAVSDAPEEEGDEEPPEGAPVAPEEAEGAATAPEPPVTTESNGEATETTPEPPAVPEELDLADDALAVIAERF
jgi:HK97 family phage prohead protease